MTAVTRAADAPRAASAISSNSTRCSCTGGTSGWIRKTSRSRQLDWSCTSRQSLANLVIRTGRFGSDRYMQISAASAWWALPLNTAMSRTGRSRRLRLSARLGGRQGEPLPDVLLDDVGGRPGVDRDHVLLATEQVQHRVGLLVIVAEPDREGLLGVVLPGHQLSPAGVTVAGHLGAVRDQVVVNAAPGAQPPVQHPAAHLAVRQVQVDDAVDVVALQEELGLPRVAREAVDDEPVIPVMLRQPVADHGLNQVVADQLAGRHHAADLRAHLGVPLHVPPEDVPDADVDQIQVGGQQLALRALAAALHPHDHVLPHVGIISRSISPGGTTPPVTPPRSGGYPPPETPGAP